MIYPFSFLFLRKYYKLMKEYLRMSCNGSSFILSVNFIFFKYMQMYESIIIILNACSINFSPLFLLKFNLKNGKEEVKSSDKIFKVYYHVSIKIVSISVSFNFSIDISWRTIRERVDYNRYSLHIKIQYRSISSIVLWYPEEDLKTIKIFSKRT